RLACAPPAVVVGNRRVTSLSSGSPLKIARVGMVGSPYVCTFSGAQGAASGWPFTRMGVLAAFTVVVPRAVTLVSPGRLICSDGAPPERMLLAAATIGAVSVASGGATVFAGLSRVPWLSVKTPDPATSTSTNDPDGENGPADPPSMTLPRSAASCSP